MHGEIDVNSSACTQMYIYSNLSQVTYKEQALDGNRLSIGWEIFISDKTEKALKVDILK